MKSQDVYLGLSLTQSLNKGNSHSLEHSKESKRARHPIPTKVQYLWAMLLNGHGGVEIQLGA